MSEDRETPHGPGRFSSEHSRPGRAHSRGKTTRELTIGRKLRELRDYRCLTQQEMAIKAGVPRTYISRIENSRLLPGPVMLRRIADALEVAILDLLPRSRQSDGASWPEEDPFWKSFTRHFSRLQPHQMSAVVEHVRRIVEPENSGQDIQPAMMAR